jgi:hypothetical protein
VESQKKKKKKKEEEEEEEKKENNNNNNNNKEMLEYLYKIFISVYRHSPIHGVVNFRKGPHKSYLNMHMAKHICVYTKEPN